MLSSLFGLQVKSIDQKLALAVLIKISTLLNLIETKEEEQRVSSMFKAYKTAFPRPVTSSGSDPSRLDQLFLEFEKLEKVFQLSSIDDGFKFNQELQELTTEFNLFFVQITDQDLFEYSDLYSENVELVSGVNLGQNRS